MLDLLRDAALSFVPLWMRKLYPPRSPWMVLRASVLTGVVQAALGSWGLVSGYIAFAYLRTQQYGSVLNHANETTQIWFGGIFFVEYVLFHPLALFCLYQAIEGFIRFVAGVCVSEVAPSLAVVLICSVYARATGRKKKRELDLLASIPDMVEAMAEDEGFLIAATQPKPGWNASITIQIGEDCYEVEREEKGIPPRIYIYRLRRAPINKIIRGYEQYELASTVRGTISKTTTR